MTSNPNPLRDHVRRCLEALRAYDEAHDALTAALEKNGRRIVDGGQTDNGWQTTDWRTGEILATGTGGIEEYESETDRLDPDGIWHHIAHIGEDLTYDHVPAVGMPQSLGEAIEDWIDTRSTTDEDIASVAEWPVGAVAECRGH